MSRAALSLPQVVFNAVLEDYLGAAIIAPRRGLNDWAAPDGRMHNIAPPCRRMDINAVNLDRIRPVIETVGCEVLVDRPEELRHRLRTAAARKLHAAGGH
ncbi:hypothetical protein JTF08_07705 [Micrococcaceae bacterium RIT802]|nr:hypothetical protein [Micrococcaceae bacterium RIT 802]